MTTPETSSSQKPVLSRYATRVGLDQQAHQLVQRAQGLDTHVLDELMAAHTRSIPFENLDVVALAIDGQRDTVPIDATSVVEKMIDGRRGGYCHEHAVLVREVLSDLGLQAFPVLGRIHRPTTLDGQVNTSPSALTHQATVAEVAGSQYLMDPGFGAGTPEYALELGGEARGNGRVEHRVVPAADVLPDALVADSQWVLQVRTLDGDSKGFRSVYGFSTLPRGQAELDVANWYTGTKPGARFTGKPMAAIYTPGGGKVTLDAAELSVDTSDTSESRTLQSADEFGEVLRSYFGITLELQTVQRLWERIACAGFHV